MSIAVDVLQWETEIPSVESVEAHVTYDMLYTRSMIYQYAHAYLY